MEPTFRVGDLAVYPAHGVAQIVGIETREISGNKQTFYILKILENGMKIMIPTRNAGAVGLRELIRADEVDEVVAPTEKPQLGIHSLGMPVEATLELSALANRAQDRAFDKPAIKRAFQREQGIDAEELAPVGRLHELGLPLKLRA